MTVPSSSPDALVPILRVLVAILVGGVIFFTLAIVSAPFGGIGSVELPLLALISCAGGFVAHRRFVRRARQECRSLDSGE